MDKKIKHIIKKAISNDQDQIETALLDLRLVIERFTMNRYGDKEIPKYLLLFNDKSLIDYHLNNDKIDFIKYFLVYLLFNFPDRAILTAKCIKVLFDISIREVICTGIEKYLTIDDGTTCELIFSITDVGDYEIFFSNQRIINLFKNVSEYGGEYSKAAAIAQLNFFHEGNTNKY